VLAVLSLFIFPANSFGQTYLISTGGTISTCSGTLYDSGGASGDYSPGEDYTITLCSDNGSAIRVDFLSGDG